MSRNLSLVLAASLALTFAACGADEDNGGDTGTDTSMEDTTMEDGGTDTTDNDTAEDVAVDTAEDVAVDTAEDVVEDVAVDTAEDVAVDTVEDTVEDVAVDTAEDVAVDAVQDVAVDTADDTADDVAVDTVDDTVSDRLAENNCTYETAIDMTGVDTVDITADSAWTFNHQACIIVSAGTVVTWAGNFSSHPLVGGISATVDADSPITAAGTAAAGGMATATLDAGDFPYFCDFHPGSMMGVIYVD